MKKLCLSVLLTTNVIFVSCMEKERSQPIPVYTNSPITPHSHRTNSPYTWQPPVCEANEPGWEFLDNIQNTNYNSHQLQPKQSQCIEEIELKPIYKTATELQQKTSLLQTNSLQPDKNIMEPLYNSARNIIAAECKGTYHHKLLTEGCVDLIIEMNNAKNKNIYENHMEKFSYQTKEYTVDIGCSRCNMNEKNIAPLIPIMFTLLKKYNTTIQQTGEKIPLHFKRQEANLNKTLSSPAQIYQNTTFNNCTNVYDDMKQYPALFQFEHAVRRSVEDLSDAALKTFTMYVYENHDIKSARNIDGAYKNFKEEFYTNAYNMVLHRGTINDLYSLVQMINQAKRLRDITNEDDLIAQTETYFSSNKPIKATIVNVFSSSYSSKNITERVILLCKLIKQYNATKNNKTTPTINQQEVYQVKTFLGIPLPEHLCNHLDDAVYAFKEFKQLHVDINALQKLTCDELNKLYESLR
jgi:hypothetical protein